MDVNKMLEGLDRLFADNRISEVEPYLKNALKEAETENDLNARLCILNELMGFYRVSSKEAEAVESGRQAVMILKNMNMSGTLPYATTMLNLANVYRAFGKLDDSLVLYKNVQEIYEARLDEDDFHMASFYNNMALLYQEMNQNEKAVELLKKALQIALKHENAASETASTYSNLGASLLKLDRISEALEMLDEAVRRYRTIGERGYHYSSALSSFAAAYFKLGDYEKSLAYYTEAADEIYNVLGENAAYKLIQENISKVKKQMDEAAGDEE